MTTHISTEQPEELSEEAMMAFTFFTSSIKIAMQVLHSKGIGEEDMISGLVSASSTALVNVLPNPLLLARMYADIAQTIAEREFGKDVSEEIH